MPLTLNYVRESKEGWFKMTKQYCKNLTMPRESKKIHCFNLSFQNKYFYLHLFEKSDILVLGTFHKCLFLGTLMVFANLSKSSFFIYSGLFL